MSRLLPLTKESLVAGDSFPLEQRALEVVCVRKSSPLEVKTWGSKVLPSRWGYTLI
ncbi:Hypothetical predicted protein [Podarcis lilfordi]|uniref:Uncharacterized protein n=1 Tax=Podarcis lilfordi TaxID=74358 RepID=A0AA35KTD0_9SAUR|nr:Hypothetical predicted protein [Podarcis lilfordi]